MFWASYMLYASGYSLILTTFMPSSMQSCHETKWSKLRSQITCQFHLQHTTQDPKVHACHARWRSNIYQHPNLDPVQTIKDISSLRTHWWCTFENVSLNKSVYTIYLKWEVVNGEWEWKVELFVYSCLFGHHIQLCFHKSFLGCFWNIFFKNSF